MPAQYVFGYGSLALLGGRAPAPAPTRAPAPTGYVTDLLDAARGWGVAMDNARDLPGYKYYRRRDDGRRPAVSVAFLDVVECAGVAVNGVCLPVDDATLAALDHRERNYVRVEVGDRLAHALGPTWAYVGSEAGRERLRRAHAAGRAVISAAYRDAVLAGFAALGPDELAAAQGSLAAGDAAVWDLERVALP